MPDLQLAVCSAGEAYAAGYDAYQLQAAGYDISAIPVGRKESAERLVLVRAERVRKQLRYASENDDVALLQSSIANAERVADAHVMESVEIAAARRKLNELLSRMAQ